MHALPSGVRRQNVVAILNGIISLSSEVLTFLPERRQLGLQNSAWAPKSKSNLNDKTWFGNGVLKTKNEDEIKNISRSSLFQPSLRATIFKG